MLFRLIIILYVVSTSLGFGQTTNQVPEVGKPMPDFVLTDVTHYRGKTASLKDFKGKWLILDFWATTCTLCIKSFDKINAQQREFNDKITWVLIGQSNGKYNKNIKQIYERLREKKELELVAAYDSVLKKKWDASMIPFIIIVDPNGIVHSRTGGRDITTEKLSKLVAGEKVSFYPYDREEPSFDTNAYVQAGNNDDLLYRSILTKWHGERQDGGWSLDRWVLTSPEEQRKGFNFAMVPLRDLYNMAFTGQTYASLEDTLFYGKHSYDPILDIKDPSAFKFDFWLDVGKGTYNYNLKLPQSHLTMPRIMACMQHDLKRVFSYDASLETRQLPVMKLIAKPGAAQKLKTKGGEKYLTPGSIPTGFMMKNSSSRFLLQLIEYYQGDKYPVFLDDTGITGNIDVTIDADMTSIEDIRRALQLNGLDLVPGTNEMTVVVIRDPKPEIN